MSGMYLVGSLPISLFIKGIPLLNPRFHDCGFLKSKHVLLSESPWLQVDDFSLSSKCIILNMCINRLFIVGFGKRLH